MLASCVKYRVGGKIKKCAIAVPPVGTKIVHKPDSADNKRRALTEMRVRAA